MSAKKATVKVRLLFVDEGSYHQEEIDLPAEGMAEYERLIDFVREDPEVLRRAHVDLGRLCAAYLVQ